MNGLVLSILLCMLGSINVMSQDFTQHKITDEVFERINGRSFRKGCPVNLSDLRYLKVLHYNINGEVCHGELICHYSISADLLEIFRQLFEARYPIERMRLVDEYDAQDEASMRSNNTSAFNFRKVSGSSILSKHAYGLAIDINPRYNPFVRYRKGKRLVSPNNAEKYAERTKDFPYKIVKGDLCYRLFKKYGFSWGGDWKNSKDYQHFEKR